MHFFDDDIAAPEILSTALVRSRRLDSAGKRIEIAYAAVGFAPNAYYPYLLKCNIAPVADSPFKECGISFDIFAVRYPDRVPLRRSHVSTILNPFVSIASFRSARVSGQQYLRKGRAIRWLEAANAVLVAEGRPQINKEKERVDVDLLPASRSFLFSDLPAPDETQRPSIPVFSVEGTRNVVIIG